MSFDNTILHSKQYIFNGIGIKTTGNLIISTMQQAQVFSAAAFHKKNFKKLVYEQKKDEKHKIKNSEKYKKIHFFKFFNYKNTTQQPPNKEPYIK